MLNTKIQKEMIVINNAAGKKENIRKYSITNNNPVLISNPQIMLFISRFIKYTAKADAKQLGTV